MTERARLIIEQAKLLTPEEREEVLDAIAATLDADDANETWEQAWGREAERRWQEHLKSGVPAEDAFEAIESIREELARRRTP